MLKCGITGSTGILGSKIIKDLKYKFYPFKGNIYNKKKVDEWLNKREYDIIIHLAAIVPTVEVNKNYKLAKKINFNGTKNLADSIIKLKKKPKWFFYASTSHVYKIRKKNKKIHELAKLDPSSKYGKTKMLAEKYLLKRFKQKKINYCIGRIFSFTDRKQKKTYFSSGIFFKITNTSKKTIYFKNVSHYRDFLSTKDIVRAIDFLQKKRSKGIFNIGSGTKTNLKTIANFFCKKYRKKPIFEKNNQYSYLISNNSKIKKIGWKPKYNLFYDLKKFIN